MSTLGRLAWAGLWATLLLCFVAAPGAQAQLGWSSFVGGTNTDYGFGIAVDACVLSSLPW